MPILPHPVAEAFAINWLLAHPNKYAKECMAMSEEQCGELALQLAEHISQQADRWLEQQLDERQREREFEELEELKRERKDD